MIFEELLKRAPGLVVIWFLALLLLLLIIIFYFIQTTHINKKGETETIRNIGNAMGGVGIALCLISAIWVILLIGLVRDSRNVWADASTIYVSRHNILTNWFLDKPGGPISGDVATDDTLLCNGDLTVTAGPQYYDKFKALIKSYQGDQPVTQLYEPVNGGNPYPKEETLLTQQKLSLAYYRFFYCTKSYFQDILNKTNLNTTNFPFLKLSTLGNLQKGESNCIPGGVPDTVACTEGSPPKCTVNPCFTALNESIAAQCLFYDDRVYDKLNAGVKKGVLDAMGLSESANSYKNLPGYQVASPPASSK